jgi:hypothetical protein
MKTKRTTIPLSYIYTTRQPFFSAIEITASIPDPNPKKSLSILSLKIRGELFKDKKGFLRVPQQGMLLAHSNKMKDPFPV